MTLLFIGSKSPNVPCPNSIKTPPISKPKCNPRRRAKTKSQVQTGRMQKERAMLLSLSLFPQDQAVTFYDDVRQHWRQETIDLCSYWVLQLAHIRGREPFRNRRGDDSMYQRLFYVLPSPSLRATWLAGELQWDSGGSLGCQGGSELDTFDTSPRPRLRTN